ncbi:9777_t:CDS:1, partial [Racocetra persica]
WKMESSSRISLIDLLKSLDELVSTYPSYSQPLKMKDPSELSNKDSTISSFETVEKG